MDDTTLLDLRPPGPSDATAPSGRGSRLPGLMAADPLPRSGGGVREPAAPRRVASLSVVVPAKNEAANLESLIAELRAVLADPRMESIAAEILVIDDGSTDATREIAERAGARVVSHAESLGNGAAIKRGIREAKLDWVLMMDGDGQHPPYEIPSMVELAESYDMVVASRGGGGGVWYRNLANRTYNLLASYVTQKRIPDLTSGFRLLRADIAKGFAYLLPNTFSYPTTLTLASLRAGYAVGFHPFAVRQRKGRSHIKILRDGSRFFMIILKVATFFAPLRVFVPLSFAMAALGVLWYLVTFWMTHRFTNMSLMLLTQATVVFGLGLISEQIAAMRFERIDRADPTTGTGPAHIPPRRPAAR